MIWLVGAGDMAAEYAKVLSEQDRKYIVIGRNELSATNFTLKTQKEVILGGLDKYLETGPEIPSSAIICVSVDKLFTVTSSLISYGVKRILVEKPAALVESDIKTLGFMSGKAECYICIAYNRRFYSSVEELRRRIIEDGGVTSFNFEFTEWAHVIEKTNKPNEVLNRWFLANSTHVADLAFHLGGKPSSMSSFVNGSLSWHSSSSVFAGAGKTDNDVLFTYSANWESAGRWSVEVLTKNARYILRPMELLQEQKKGSISIETLKINDSLDHKFKPGLYRQVEAFLTDERRNLCDIKQQILLFPFYLKMAGYCGADNAKNSFG